MDCTDLPYLPGGRLTVVRLHELTINSKESPLPTAIHYLAQSATKL